MAWYTFFLGQNNFCDYNHFGGMMDGKNVYYETVDDLLFNIILFIQNL